MKKFIKPLIATILIVCLTITTSMQALAFGAKTYYLSDLKVAYGSNDDDVKKSLTNAGYSVINHDLNSNADTALSKKACSYIGYKQTTDAKKAITDIAMLTEEIGYAKAGIDDILGNKANEFKEMAKQEMEIIKVFRTNYKNDTPLAVNAKLTLDNYIDDDSKRLMGDKLLDESFTENDLYKFMPQVNTDVLKQINEMLISSISEGASDNFLTRVNAMTDAEIAKSKTDKSLYDTALIIKQEQPTIKNIFDLLLKGIDTYTNEDMIANMLSINALALVSNNKIGEKSIYDMIMDTNTDITEFYPIVSQMTEAQRATVKLIGFYSLVTKTGLNDKGKMTSDEIRKDYEKEKPDKISVYEGVDRKLFTGNVVITSDVARQIQATNDPSPVYGNVGDGVELAAHIVSGTLFGLAGITKIAIYALNKYANAYKGGRLLGREVLNDKLISELPSLEAESTKIITRAENLSKNKIEYRLFSGKLSRICTVVMIVAVLIEVTMLILNLYNYYNPEHVEIPDIVIDKKVDSDGNISYINYDVAKTPDGKKGDLNAMVGKKWNAVFFTKDPNAGKPIQVSSIVYASKNGQTVTPPKGNYMALHNFGETSATDTNGYTFNDKTSIFVFFPFNKNYNSNTYASIIGTSGMYSSVAGVCGIIIGSFGTYLIVKSRRKKEEETEINDLSEHF